MAVVNRDSPSAEFAQEIGLRHRGKATEGERVMIIRDSSLPLYAYDASSPFHARAAKWRTGCLRGGEPIGLLPVVVFGFVRGRTSLCACQHLMIPAEAAAHVRSWLGQPPVECRELGPGYPERALKLLESVVMARNLVTDAQIAAAALDEEAVLHTTDSDFIRFGGVRWFNPITGANSSGTGRIKRA